MIDLGMGRVRALRVTYVGEKGWELHVPVEQMQAVYDAICEAGQDLGLMAAGHYAINSLRLEKGYRAFGAELSPDETPMQAGLGFVVAWNKSGGFVGRDALLQAKEEPLKKRLVGLALQDSQPMLWGYEPILRDNVLVGYTTSGAYGHSVGASVALGYLKHMEGIPSGWIESGSYRIRVNGRDVPATLSLKPFYDPDRRRILA